MYTADPRILYILSRIPESFAASMTAVQGVPWLTDWCGKKGMNSPWLLPWVTLRSVFGRARQPFGATLSHSGKLLPQLLLGDLSECEQTFRAPLITLRSSFCRPREQDRHWQLGRWYHCLPPPAQHRGHLHPFSPLSSTTDVLQANKSTIFWSTTFKVLCKLLIMMAAFLCVKHSCIIL